MDGWNTNLILIYYFPFWMAYFQVRTASLSEGYILEHDSYILKRAAGGLPA